MSKLKIRHGIGDVSKIMPAGIIFGLAPTASRPPEWTDWTLADGFFLKGTDNDLLLNTYAATDSISYGSTSSGGHSNSGPNYMQNIGRSNVPTGDALYNTSINRSNEGSHNHAMSIDYEPASFTLKLVKANQDTQLFAGAICFSTIAQPDHQYHTDSAGMLRAGNTTNVTSETGIATVANANDSHDHLVSIRGDADSITTAITSSGSGGGSHNHTWSPTFTHNVKHALMRVYEVVNTSKVDGIIGIWDETGAIPDGWEVVAELTDNYLKFDGNGDGTVSGNNTVDISGNTGSRSHSHSQSGSVQAICSSAPHSGNVSHNHNGSRTALAFEPERYYVKFIRKLS